AKAADVDKDSNFLTTATVYSETVKPVPTEEKPIVRVGLSQNGTWKYFSYGYTFLPGVPRPVFTPAGGAVPEGTEVELTLEREGVAATIYYTTNDSVPQVGKSFTLTYTQKIVVNQAMTIKAIAVTAEGESSKMTSATYTIQTTTPEEPKDTVETPVFSRASGKVEKGTRIVISCSTPDAVIYYALDGDEPTTASEVYSEPIAIEAVTTIKAIAVKDGWVNSEVAEATYLVLADPTPGIALGFNPASGSTVNVGTSVTIGTGGAKGVFYMMYGSLEEAKAAEWDQDRARPYDAEMPPVLSEAQNTIKATYTMDGELLADTFFYATYIIKKAESVNLTFLPASGSVVEDSTEITVSASMENAVIYYRVYEDSMASVEGSDMFMADAYMISVEGNPVITKGKTFLKCGVFDNKAGGLKYFYASYKIKEPEAVLDTVEKPTFSLSSGLVAKGAKVAISCATEDAHIYYTLDGAEPTIISLPYSDSIVINESMTLKAVAFKAGMTKSEVAVAYYTLRTVANETEELAGVSLYPNPNDGLFHISVPVDAQVEVFTVGGQLVERLALTAGTHSLRVENSGLYFVRVRANGQVTIQKVLVY
ncbi:MAG: chitobiase/beta-hexosaminidase C-terminal domain-containing protein, partial [Bacteroidales bacterium]|nr:chitobiase/beta-hexosaminidase C-terminal domain-containing protein [Bacteroidales bacterium]